MIEHGMILNGLCQLETSNLSHETISHYKMKYLYFISKSYNISMIELIDELRKFISEVTDWYRNQ